MSDSVRSLVVSLYLDSGKFDKAIRLVNKEIKQAESEFKLAGAGVKDFEKTLKGVDAKAEMLRKTLKGQTENVSALTGKLTRSTSGSRSNTRPMKKAPHSTAKPRLICSSTKTPLRKPSGRLPRRGRAVIR